MQLNMPLVVVEQPGLALPSPAMPSPDAPSSTIQYTFRLDQARYMHIQSGKEEEELLLLSLYSSSVLPLGKLELGTTVILPPLLLFFSLLGAAAGNCSPLSPVWILLLISSTANLHHKQFWRLWFRRHKQLGQLASWIHKEVRRTARNHTMCVWEGNTREKPEN